MLNKMAPVAALVLLLSACSSSNGNNNNSGSAGASERSWNRIASFLVCTQIDPDCDDDTETASEIVTATDDGLTLIYSDSPAEVIGFIDITDPANPVADGTFDVGGEPTSVDVVGDFAVVGVNTSPDFVSPSGFLAVVDVASRSLVTTIDLGGQPDSVKASADGNYIAIAIENERDEDLGDGAPPQLPAGYLAVIDSSAADPTNWTRSDVAMVGVADLFPSDPEPEFVDINDDNIAAVTLQENNHIILVDLASGTITGDFSAGSVDLTQIDATEEEPAIISQTESQTGIPREPDGVVWLNNDLLATADEGDLDGGSRGFTIFDTSGSVVFTSGNTNDHIAARLGHYPDARSGNKGNEPENVAVGTFGDDSYLFLNSERSSLVFVYDVNDPRNPVHIQTLPTAIGPEGGLTIASRNLLVIASEEDAREDGFRSAVNIYRLDSRAASYPTLMSADRSDGTPIPWAAMSGLGAETSTANLMYAVEDSFYGSNRIFTIDTASQPAMLTAETTIRDSNNVFAAVATDDVGDDNDVFSSNDLAAMINDDDSVNIDPEGIARASDGGFWVASEGAGTVGDDSRPVDSLNFIFKTDTNGVIEDVVTLPPAINAQQLRFGFEGVTESDGNVYVAFQRVWSGLGDSDVRIGIYNIANDAWSFLFYPLEAPTSPNGGWVGLSDITALGGGEFVVVERDNQSGPDARIKRLYRFSTAGLNDGDTVSKILVRNLVADLTATGGLVPEKIEGGAVDAAGNFWIVNDNDGVDDNSGETQLLNLGELF